MVEAEVLVADNQDPAPRYRLVSVISSEPDNGLGDGNTSNDIVVVDDTHVKLRAERSVFGSGRIYTLTYEVVDFCGNSAEAKAEVRVPHYKKRNGKRLCRLLSI